MKRIVMSAGGGSEMNGIGNGRYGSRNNNAAGNGEDSAGNLENAVAVRPSVRVRSELFVMWNILNRKRWPILPTQRSHLHRQ
jgi:hypothetical protein